jgi:hypothetical protein
MLGMPESNKIPARKREERQVILRTLRDLLETIGSANDAEDHGYTEEADRMRKDSCDAIQGMITQNVFIVELFPKLQWELDTQHILVFGWAELYDAVNAHLKVPVNEQRNG